MLTSHEFSYIEVTFYFDVFTKQILTWKMAERRGDRNQYIDGMTDVVNLLRGNKEPTIVHTDQGSVYASMAYNDLIRNENIQRSMSRAGTPTDNAAMEAINGWIKAEVFNDLHLTGKDNVQAEVERYIVFFNEERPAYSLNYLTPKQYRQYHGW